MWLLKDEDWIEFKFDGASNAPEVTKQKEGIEITLLSYRTFRRRHLQPIKLEEAQFYPTSVVAIHEKGYRYYLNSKAVAGREILREVYSGFIPEKALHGKVTILYRITRIACPKTATPFEFRNIPLP